MTRWRRVSVALALMAVLPRYRYSVPEISFCIGAFLVGCGSSAFWQGLAGFNIFKITYFNIFKLSHWNKGQKMRGWNSGSHKSHAMQRTILWIVCLLFFVHKVVSRYLTVVQVLLLPTLLSCEVCFFPCCVIKLIVDRAPSHYLHTRKRLCLMFSESSFLRISPASNENAVQLK